MMLAKRLAIVFMTMVATAPAEGSPTASAMAPDEFSYSFGEAISLVLNDDGSVDLLQDLAVGGIATAISQLPIPHAAVATVNNADI